MKNIDVIKSFIQGKKAKSHTGNLYTLDNKLMNYNTVLAQRNGDSFIVNATKYSVTTSKIQTYIKSELRNAGIDYTGTHKGIRIGIQDLTAHVETV